MKCKICSKVFSSVNFSSHLRVHNITKLDYYIKYEDFKIPKCSVCKNDAKVLKGLKFHTTCGQEDCISKHLSEKLKQAHAEGRHKGWHHINSSTDNMSYPEKVFLNLLTEYGIYSKYNVEIHFPIGGYFLDFAIIDLKIDIEIDGQQHYRDEKSIEHDKKRDFYFENNGWKVFRIKWLDLDYENKDIIMEQLINFIENIDNSLSIKYTYDVIIVKEHKKPVKEHKKPVYGKMREYKKALKIQYEEKEKIKIPLVLNSNINFTKFGWVSKVSKIIEKHPQKVNKWIKRFMPDFYEKNCFKKNI